MNVSANKRLIIGLRKYHDLAPIVVPVRGIEEASVNVIPAALAKLVAVLTVETLRVKYGSAFEYWWKDRFGFGFETLTESEARYLLLAEDADTIRRRLAEAKFEREF